MPKQTQAFVHVPTPYLSDGYGINPYHNFYTSFLTTLNSLPMNSLWGVFITEIPIDYIKKIVQTTENWTELADTSTINFAKSNVGDAQKRNGMLIAQGVKTIGEEISVERTGIKNTGFIQGLINQGRTGFPLLKMELMENTLSFVDYVIRPWIVAVAHNSLKDPILRSAKIEVVFLAKTGAGEPLQVRKNIIYEGCCPVTVDEFDANYTGADMLRTRSIQFAFSKYTLMPASRYIVNELNNQSGPTNKEKIKAWIEERPVHVLPDYPEGFYSDKPDRRDGTTGGKIDEDVLESSFRYVQDTDTRLDPLNVSNNPSGGYLNNLIADAGTFASNTLKGAINGVVNNVKSTVTNRIDQVINQTKSNIQMKVNDLVNKSDDALERAIGAGGAVASSRDVRPVIVPNPKDDAPIHAATEVSVNIGLPAVVDFKKATDAKDVRNNELNHQGVTRLVNPNDARNNELNHQGVEKQINPNDARKNELNHQGVEQSINQDDYISGKGSGIVYNIVQTNQNDVRKTNADITYNQVSTNPNDVRKTKEGITFNRVSTNQNDVRKTKEAVQFPNVVTNVNDVRKTKEPVQYPNVVTDVNDVRKTKEPVKFPNVVTNVNDVRETNAPVPYVHITTNVEDARETNAAVVYQHKVTNVDDSRESNVPVNALVRQIHPLDVPVSRNIKYTVKTSSSRDAR